MQFLLQRSFIGFVAGAIAVLTFHQALVGVLHALELGSLPPYRTVLVPPFWIPVIVSRCFWGGVYGALLGAVMPHVKMPPWAAGLMFGLVAVLVGWFVVSPLKGLPVAAGFALWPMARSLIVNLIWGLATGSLIPLLSSRSLWRHAHG